MPRRGLNTKAATTWRKDSSQIDYQMMQEKSSTHTALKRRERGLATDAIRRSEIRGYVYPQKSASYTPAAKANTTAETRRKIPAQVNLKRIWCQMFLQKKQPNAEFTT